MRPPAKILVIDDEAVVCLSCLRVLAADGHDVSMALTGDEALRKIQDDCFDVALLDLKIRTLWDFETNRSILDELDDLAERED